MNILFLDQFSELGGAQQCMLDLLPAIAEQGWRMHAAVPPGGPLIHLLRDRGVRVHEIQCGPYQSGSKSLPDVFRFASDVPRQKATIARLLAEWSMDLVYVNGPRLLMAAKLATRRHLPILFHAHHCVGQSAAARVEGLLLQHSNATIAACCDATAQPLRQWVAPERIHTVPNGTPDLGFLERRFGEQREMRIGVIGRISPEKGQSEFLRAAALLLSQFPHLRFVVCGAPLFGDRRYYNQVLQLAAGLPVEFLDWQNDIGAVMRNLDLLAIPSTQEGMPRVLLEAFSAGLPVIAFPVGGIPEVIEDGITGLLTSGLSSAELASSLEKVLRYDTSQLNAIALAARRKWEREYTLAVYRERIINLMKQCVPYATSEIKERPSHTSATRQ